MEAESPNIVAPQPVPITVQVAAVPAPGGKQLVQVVLNSPTGAFVWFLEPDDALRVADFLRDHATRARSGIEVVRNAEPGKGNGGHPGNNAG